MVWFYTALISFISPLFIFIMLWHLFVCLLFQHHRNIYGSTYWHEIRSSQNIFHLLCLFLCFFAHRVEQFCSDSGSLSFLLCHFVSGFQVAKFTVKSSRWIFALSSNASAKVSFPLWVLVSSSLCLYPLL